MRVILILLAFAMPAVAVASKVDECAVVLERLESLDCAGALREFAGFFPQQRPFFQAIEGDFTAETVREIVALQELFVETGRALRDCLVKFEGDPKDPYAEALIEASSAGISVEVGLKFWAEKGHDVRLGEHVLKEFDRFLDSVERASELAGT